MSLLVLEESECFEKILIDYSEKVPSKEDYYLWANKKYQDLIKLLENPNNSELFYRALNLVMYLDPVSLTDKKLKEEIQWCDLFEWDKKNIKESMFKEFDPKGEERKRVASELDRSKKTEGMESVNYR